MKVNQRFGRTCCLHFQGRRISQESNKPEASSNLKLQTYFSTLKKEAKCSSETSVDFHWIAWRCTLVDRTLHKHRCDNLNLTSLKCLQIKNDESLSLSTRLKFRYGRLLLSFLGNPDFQPYWSTITPGALSELFRVSVKSFRNVIEN
jgi:hypothetical protein